MAQDLKEDIIKLRHNCSTTRYWNAQKRDFQLIMHEHLFVFRKPEQDEDVRDYKDSMINNFYPKLASLETPD